MNKREMFSTVPAMSAIAIMTVVSVLGSIGTHPIGILMIALVGIVLTMITIDSGGHAMLMCSAVFLLFLVGLSIERLELSGAVPWAFAGVIALAYADAVRLTFAERRHGVIEPEVYQGVIVGLVIVVILSGATAAVVVGLGAASANASWLLVPLALVLAVVGLVGLAIAVSKSPGQFDKRRWKPGERLMAPPRSASDDPSLKTSSPPAPPPPNQRP